MTDEEYVKRVHPDAEITSRQNGVYSEYCVKLDGWPNKYLPPNCKWWHKDQAFAWFFARRYLENLKRRKSHEPSS